MTPPPVQVPASLPPCIRSSYSNQPKRVLPNSNIIIYHAIAGQRFLVLRAQPYPIQGGVSPVGGIPRSLIIDSCRILTGTYTEDVFICSKNDPFSSLEFDFLPAGNYVYVVGSLNQPANYGVYTKFTTWQPPTRAQVPDYWFTPKYPKEATTSFEDLWDTGSWPDCTDMRSAMSEQAKMLASYTCSLTLVESISVEGCHVVPVEFKNFVRVIALLNKLFI